jgi:hypothetical protein
MSETSSNVPLLQGESTRTSYATAAASAPIPIPGAGDAAQSSKRVKHARTVSDADKVTEEADQIAPVRAGDDTSYDPVPIVSPADRLSIFIDEEEGLGDYLWLDEEVLEAMASALVLQGDAQLHTNNFVIGRLLTAYPQDEWPTVRLLEKRHKGATEPTRWQSDTTGYLYKIWCRRSQPVSKKALHLIPNGNVQHVSYEDRSFGWMSSIAYVWPPPLVIGMEDEFSCLFSFALVDVQRERETLAVLRYKLAAKYSGGFFALVRPLLALPIPF